MMEKALIWIVSNGLFVLGVYLAFFQDVDIAKNMVLFWAWFSFAVSILICFGAYNDDCVKTMRETYKKNPIPKSIDFLLDFSVSLCFAAFGHFVIAAFYILHTILLHSAKEEIEKGI